MKEIKDTVGWGIRFFIIGIVGVVGGIILIVQNI